MCVLELYVKSESDTGVCVRYILQRNITVVCAPLYYCTQYTVCIQYVYLHTIYTKYTVCLCYKYNTDIFSQYLCVLMFVCD